MKTKSRPMPEIIKEAELTLDINGLINLWSEIARNKYSYALTEIWAAADRLAELALKTNGEDIEKGKFYHWLKSMRK